MYPFSPPKVGSLLTQVVRRDLSTVFFQNTSLFPQTNNYKITFLYLIFLWPGQQAFSLTGQEGRETETKKVYESLSYCLFEEF